VRLRVPRASAGGRRALLPPIAKLASEFDPFCHPWLYAEGPSSVGVDFQVYEPQWTTCCIFLATNAENRAISVDPRDKPKNDMAELIVCLMEDVPLLTL
jgi:hypothetical protein